VPVTLAIEACTWAASKIVSRSQYTHGTPHGLTCYTAILIGNIDELLERVKTYAGEQHEQLEDDTWDLDFHIDG
jgi:hypothetical protein